MRLPARYVPLLVTAGVFAAFYATGAILFDHFASRQVLASLLGDNAFLGVAAVGATFVILSGGIDLSVGGGDRCQQHARRCPRRPGGLHPLLAFGIAAILGTLFGAGMGSLIHLFRLPPFLVTLAGMFFARSVGFLVHPQSLGIDHPFFGGVWEASIPLGGRASLSLLAVAWILLTVFGVVVLHHTRFGRNVYALGGDESAARLMGLPVGTTKIAVYAFAGFCSALAGAAFSIYMQSGNPASCVGLELDVIAAVVIGGTLLSGGRGYVAGTFLGVLTLGLIQTLINFQGTLSSWWTRIVVGLLLLAFILLQRVLGRAITRR